MTTWAPAPLDLPLGSEDVHVCCVTLDERASDVARCEAVLDREERARAARFRRRTDHDRFVIAHGALRTILAGCVGCDPVRVSLTVDGDGKPRLGGPSEIRFNASRSEGLGLVALARGREVGVDVERCRPELAGDAVAACVFAASETAALRALPAAARAEAFFTVWTCKEAFVKALGCGLAAGLDRFAVSLEDPHPIVRDVDGVPLTGWTLSTLDPAPGYAAALAVEGSDWQLRSWHWTGHLALDPPAPGWFTVRAEQA
jgi:4'-phosphopantetheinyl transferase